MRTLGLSLAHVDPVLPMMALAIEADIFVEDAAALLESDPTKMSFPVRLTVKADKAKQPVFRAARTDGPLTYVAANGLFKKLVKFVGFTGEYLLCPYLPCSNAPTDCTFVTFRYSWATAMVDRVSKVSRTRPTFLQL
jgi:hypothetical protein